MKVGNGCKSILHLGPRVFLKPGNGQGIRTDTKPAAIQKLVHRIRTVAGRTRIANDTDQELTALRIQILEERRSDSAQAHCDPEAARRLLERDEKELQDFEFSFGTFRKNIECQDPGDLRTRMDEGQKWMQEHFAPWAKSFLETRQQSPRRWKEMTHATNQAD